MAIRAPDGAKKKGWNFIYKCGLKAAEFSCVPQQMKGMEAREKALIKPAELKQQCIDSGEKKSAAAALANSV